MKFAVSKNVIGTATLVLLMVLSVSYDALGQGRSRRVRGFDKKCEKFVNCHDARDGRWDGRGPRRDVSLSDRIFGRVRRNRDSDIWSDRRGRRRDRDDDRFWRRRR